MIRPLLRLMLLTPILTLAPVASGLALENSAAGDLTRVPVELNAEQQQIQNIIRISGLSGLSEQARNIAQQIMNEQSAPLGQQYDVVDRLTHRWAPPALEAELSGVLLQHMNERQRSALESTLDSQLLQGMRARELQAIAEQSGAGFQQYISRLRATPPAGPRLLLIQQLDQAMQFSALMTVTRAQVYPQLEAVLSGWKPPQNWQTDLQRDVIEFLLYVHRATPNDELQKVIRLYRQPEVQQWLSGVRKELSAG